MFLSDISCASRKGNVAARNKNEKQVVNEYTSNPCKCKTVVTNIFCNFWSHRTTKVHCACHSCVWFEVFHTGMLADHLRCRILDPSVPGSTVVAATGTGTSTTSSSQFQPSQPSKGPSRRFQRKVDSVPLGTGGRLYSFTLDLLNLVCPFGNVTD